MVSTELEQGNMNDQGAEPKSFRDRTYLKAMAYVLTPPIVLIFLYAAGLSIKVGNFGAAICFAIAAAYFVILTWLALMLASTIVVSYEGVAAQNFGRTSKFIRWDAIKKIVRWTTGNVPTVSTFPDWYRIYDGEGELFGIRRFPPNLRGPVIFNGRLENIRELLDQISIEAARHQFPLFVMDRAAARKIAAQSGEGDWQQLSAKPTEVKVDAF
jgi:hypothetical protein